MADVTSGGERALRVIRAPLSFGTIIVVGGGCYGSYYVRQLGRAAAAGAASWRELIVVDRNPQCAVARLPAGERPDRLRVAVASWDDFFARYFERASELGTDAHDDAIVPSPLMPHLMAEWLVARARERWPSRTVTVEPLRTPPDVPWQMVGADGTHYVSFAEWICPINCVEPARCPATRGERTWSLPPTLTAYAAAAALGGPFIFHCSHRTHGVGMIDVRAVLAADRAIATGADQRGAEFLVGTASHCHGALQRIVIGV